MTRTFSDGHPKVLPACNFLSQYYFYNIFLQKSCRFSLQTLTKFEAAKTGSGVGFLRLTAVCLVAWPVQRDGCRGEFQKKILNEAEEIASLNMVARKQYSSINFLEEFIESIS